MTIVKYLEAAYELISVEYNEKWGVLFAESVRIFVDRYNLAYKVEAPFKIIPLVTGYLSKVCEIIEREQGEHGDLPGLWKEFEVAYSQFLREGGDQKTPLQKASNYIEALIGENRGERGKTLSAMLRKIEECGGFPHKVKLKESIHNLYGFACDYPGIRHGGTPANKNRELGENDTAYLSLLFMVWAGYLHSLEMPEPVPTSS